MKPSRMMTILGLGFLTAASAWATPANWQRLDGLPTEYDGNDLRGVYTGSDYGDWGPGNVITNLYVTWDRTNLYVALQGYFETQPTANKLAVLIDVDPGNGTGPTTTTNWILTGTGYIDYNDVGWTACPTGVAFGMDYMLASQGEFNNILRALYNDGTSPSSSNIVAVFDQGNRNKPINAPTDMVIFTNNLPCDLRGFETRIPWAELYNTNRFGTVEPGETVPRGATLRLLANLHNNVQNDPFSSPQMIPRQVSANAFWNSGRWVSDTYLDVAVDSNNDGLPDIAPGDVNAPYLTLLQGASGKRQVYAMFNEPLSQATAEAATNWSIGGGVPVSATLVQTNAVLLALTNDLPAASTQVKGLATGLQDSYGNAKSTHLCFFPVTGGLETSVTVRFYLQANSGLGAFPGGTNFFINGSAAPLEWGYPPAMSSPLAKDAGFRYYRDVTFPPGSPVQLYYKYSGIMTNGSGRGTNNFEAIRLHDYANQSRILQLNTNGISMVVTDYLGAAAHPWRDPNTVSNAMNDLFTDSKRGDAGVRQRTTVTFQLDLSKRNLAGITRVLVVGGDPLRGFNSDGSVSDWPGNSGVVGWDYGGVDMTHVGNGIYSCTWVFSTNGVDDIAEPDAPNSLVGGDYATPPYYGNTGWLDGRSPRSFAYKFAVVRDNTTAIVTPGGDIQMYLGEQTNVVLDPYLWDNNDLPFAPPSNAPAFISATRVGSDIKLVFTNAPAEGQHGVQVSSNLGGPWQDYGQRAATNLAGQWEAYLPIGVWQACRAFAGPPKPWKGMRWSPNPMPATGGTLRIMFSQHSRPLAGDTNVQIAGTFNGWGATPMTFAGDGLWTYDLPVLPADADTIEFKARNLAGTTWLGMNDVGGNYMAYKGDLRATWTPATATNDQLFTITYDAAGGTLAAATSVYAHLGFDESWGDVADRPMTNIGGTVWQLAFTVPTNHTLSINFVFNGNVPPGGGQFWDSESSSPLGRLWRAFIAEP